MTLPPDPPPERPPATFAEQELSLIRTVLTARGWTVTDARQDGETLTIIARRSFPSGLTTAADLARRG